MSIAEAGSEHALDTAARTAITTAHDQELTTADSVVICLAHLYPMYQVDLDCLKGGDVALYSLLQGTDLHELEVVPVMVNRGELLLPAIEWGRR